MRKMKENDYAPALMIMDGKSYDSNIYKEKSAQWQLYYTIHQWLCVHFLVQDKKAFKIIKCT
jgi:hypothetical protein